MSAVAHVERDIINKVKELYVSKEALKKILEFYFQEGLNIIPLQPADKKPMLKTWKEYQKKKLYDDVELASTDIYVRLANIGVICGSVSYNFFVIDFDTEELYQKFIENLSQDIKEIIKNTTIVKTKKGFHIWLKGDDFCPKTQKFDKIDLKGEGGYVVAPPSIHPDLVRYEFYQLNPIQKVSQEQFDDIISIIYKITGTSKNKTEIRQKSKHLSIKPSVSLVVVDDESKIDKIIETIRPFYKEGSRQDLLIGLCGLLRRSGYSYQFVERLITRIIDELEPESKPSEKRRRYDALDYTYKKDSQDVAYMFYLQKFGQEFIDKLISCVRDLSNSLVNIIPIETVHANLLTPGFSVKYLFISQQGVFLCKEQKTKDAVIVRSKQLFNIYIECLEKSVDVFTGVAFYKVRIGNNIVYGTYDRILSILANAGYIVSPDAVNYIGFILNKQDYDLMLAILGIYKNYINYDTEYTEDELKEALENLILISEFFKKTKTEHIFWAIIKWALASPVFVTIKDMNRYCKNVILAGVGGTGKSTLGYIALKIFYPNPEKYTIFAQYSEAKLREYLKSTTLPLLFDESSKLLENPHLSSIIKQITVSNPTFKNWDRKAQLHVDIKIPGPGLILTMNDLRALQQTNIWDLEAFKRRFIIFEFTKDNIPSLEAKRRLQDILSKVDLTPIGKFAVKYIYEKLKKEENIDIDEYGEPLATEIIKSLSEYVKLPDIAFKNIKDLEEMQEREEESEVERVIDEIYSIVLEEAPKFLDKNALSTYSSFASLAELYLKKNMSKYFIVRGANVYITSSFVKRLGITLKDLEHILKQEIDCEYAYVKGRYYVRTSLDSFLSLFNPPVACDKTDEVLEQIYSLEKGQDVIIPTDLVDKDVLLKKLNLEEFDIYIGDNFIKITKL